MCQGTVPCHTLMQTIQQKSDNISKAVSQLQELLIGIEE